MKTTFFINEYIPSTQHNSSEEACFSEKYELYTSGDTHTHVFIYVKLTSKKRQTEYYIMIVSIQV